MRVVDDQPVAAGFFGQGRWLSSYIQPSDLEVRNLYEKLILNTGTAESRILNCWTWVANKVQYKAFIKASINIEGQTYHQPDYWQDPGMCCITKVGNCVNKAFLLTSLLRNELQADEVYCVLGNLYNGKAGGHAWVQIRFGNRDYIMESTRPDVQPMVPVEIATRYEAVHIFNDVERYVIPGKTVMEPYAKAYSAWLVDYIDWCYVEGRKK